MQRVLVVVSFALVLALTPAIAVAATPPTDATQQEFDRETFTIHVYENGSARWTFSYQRVLANQSEQRQFESYAEEFNTDTTQAYRDFVARADSLTAIGTNETGREMNATGFSKRAYVRTGVNDVGVVEMSFQWTNFAAQRGDRLSIGDVFEGGLTVSADQRLVVTWADGLSPVMVDPRPQQGVGETGDAFVWQGESGGAQFLDRQPRVVFAPADQVGTVTVTVPTDAAGGAGPSTAGTDGTRETGTAASSQSSRLPVWPFAFGAVVLVALGGLAFRHGYLDDDFGDGMGVTTGDGDDGEDPPSTDRPTHERTESPESAFTDEELMSDEDRVRSLLARNGGRMKQVAIVEETGWSKSKVSMLLSEMEAEDEIHKLRVGRENVISQAGDEPDATRPSFDEE